MEDSESNAIFKSLNLSPQLFINGLLNFVDDLADMAFNYFLEASAQMKTEATDRAADLNRGVAYIRNLVQVTLDNRLKKWEEYSLRFCFRVPEGFSLPKAECQQETRWVCHLIKEYLDDRKKYSTPSSNPSSPDDLPDLDALADSELDVQLSSLRDKLTSVGKESTELSKELCALEKQSLSSNQCAGSVGEAVELYEKQATTKVLQEFRAKWEKRNRRSMEELQSIRSKRFAVPQEDVFPTNHGKDLFNGKLDDLQQFLDEI